MIFGKRSARKCKNVLHKMQRERGIFISRQAGAAQVKSGYSYFVILIESSEKQ